MTPERKRFLLYAMVYALALSAGIRTSFGPCPSWMPKGTVALISGVFVLLLLLGPVFARVGTRWVQLGLALETAVAVVLILLVVRESPSMMFFAVGIQALIFLPMRRALQWIVGQTVVVVSMQFYVWRSFEGVGSSLIYVSGFLFIGLFAYLLSQQEEATRQGETLLRELREAHHQLKQYTVQAQELAIAQERNRIARELHDAVTQTLFSMNLLAQTAQVMARPYDATLQSHLKQLQKLAQDALSEMRYLLFQLRPGPTHERGLLPALRQHIENVQQQYPIHISLEADGEADLSSEQTHKLFRITQEALNNVVKHAETDEAKVHLHIKDAQLELSIEDQGKGFSVGVPDAEGATMGLRSMRERAAMLGASFHLQSEPGKGTHIHVAMPL